MMALARANKSNPKPLPLRGSEPSRRIRLSDEEDLTWYWGKGQAIFERSTMGGQLDRQGAALNSVQIAELLVERSLLP